MSALLTKARTAARAARLLLEAGDTDGAVNRAYYAMFGAARAALATVRLSLSRSKRHGTIFRRFGKHLVDGRGFDRLLGRAFLIRQRGARQAADYTEGQIDERTARSVIHDMDRFLAAIEPFLTKPRTRSANAATGQSQSARRQTKTNEVTP